MGPNHIIMLLNSIFEYRGIMSEYVLTDSLWCME